MDSMGNFSMEFTHMCLNFELNINRLKFSLKNVCLDLASYLWSLKKPVSTKQSNPR